MLITSRAAREQKLAELEAIAAFGNLTADGRELLARLRRNDTIADAVSRLADIAPDIDDECYALIQPRHDIPGGGSA